MACSPGVRSWSMSSRATPDPLSQTTMSPTALPCPSFISTLVLAALRNGRTASARNNPSTRQANCFISWSLPAGWNYSQLCGGGVQSGAGEILLHLQNGSAPDDALGWRLAMATGHTLG